MQEIFKSRKFYITLFLATAIVFLAFININRAFKSETDILVIFKSEKAAESADIILENLKVLPKSLSFYDKVIADNKDAQNEQILELPDYKRQKYWNETINIERIGGSSVLKFVAMDKDQYNAEVLSTQTVKSLIRIIGVYYDIKNDIDIRIINEPITESSFAGSYGFVFLESLLLGIILAFILNYSLVLLEQNQPEEEKRASFSWTYKEKKELEILPQEKKYQGFTKKASAPMNLPIAEDLIFEVSKKPEEKTPLTHEATPEQVKERLNKLLSGKL
jgi:hypothetical protein